MKTYKSLLDSLTPKTLDISDIIAEIIKVLGIDRVGDFCEQNGISIYGFDKKEDTVMRICELDDDNDEEITKSITESVYHLMFLCSLKETEKEGKSVHTILQAACASVRSVYADNDAEHEKYVGFLNRLHDMAVEKNMAETEIVICSVADFEQFQEQFNEMMAADVDEEFGEDMFVEDVKDLEINSISDIAAEMETYCSDEDVTKLTNMIFEASIMGGAHIVMRCDNEMIADALYTRTIANLESMHGRFNHYILDATEGVSQFPAGMILRGKTSAIYMDTSASDRKLVKNIIFVKPAMRLQKYGLSSISTKVNYYIRITLMPKALKLSGGNSSTIIDVNEDARYRAASIHDGYNTYIAEDIEQFDENCERIVKQYILDGRSTEDTEKLFIEAYKNSTKADRQGYLEACDFEQAAEDLGWNTNDYTLARELNGKLHKEIKGQAQAIKAIDRAVKIAYAGLAEEDKPICSMLFVGPTGTGKTETAKQLAKALNRPFVRLDMSEYADETAVNKINGSSAGYVGYDDGSVLEKLMDGKEKCVLLLDEVEKAHPKVFDTLLQILDNGILHTNKGEDVNFRDAIIIMTSNSGISDMGKHGVGFNSVDSTDEKNDKGISECVEAALRRQFRGEFLNRIDNIVQFNAIDEKTAREIADKMINELLARVKYTVDIDESCYVELTKKGTDIRFGAREIKRAISNDIKSAIAEAIIDNNIDDNSKMVIKYHEGEVNIDIVEIKEVA